MKQDEAKALIRDAWRKRPADKRASHDVLIFYGELATSGSYMLQFACAGDRYQAVKRWLDDLTTES